MKRSITISALLLTVIMVTRADGRSFQVSQTKQEMCNEGRLSELAACGCYVQARILHATTEELGLCEQYYGVDLDVLKPHCERFKNGDEIDVNGLIKAISEVQTTCLSEFMGSNRIVEGCEAAHSDRLLRYVVVAIIAFFPTRA